MGYFIVAPIMKVIIAATVVNCRQREKDSINIVIIAVTTAIKSTDKCYSSCFSFH